MADAALSGWLPVCALAALEPGGAPVRVTLAGRRMVAFRLPDGTPGLVQEACAHRCASLVLARNENAGLRCIYHGWLYAPDGALLEVPTEDDPVRARALRARLRIDAWPVERRGDQLWANASPS